MRFTLPQGAAMIGIGGSLLAISVPTFLANLSASKLSEPVDNLSRLVGRSVAYGNVHSGLESFPPSVPMTPQEVPRGVSVVDPPGTWEHLTWRALDFRITREHAFAYEFSSAADPITGTCRFTVTAHGDLDGDGELSTFSVYGEKVRGSDARAVPGLYVERELE